MNQFQQYAERILIHGHIATDAVVSENFRKWSVVNIVFNYFQEDYRNLFTIVETDVPIEDIPTKTYPHIVVFGGLPKEGDSDTDHATTYCVVVDGIAFPKNPCIIEALKYLIVVYFNFNHTYENAFAHFLEFLQRCFMEIYPIDGNRSNVQIIKKVQTFIKRIKAIEIQDIV
ncbi:uncharacterized protein LOC103317814 isoform X2 [Nasonia vitripennis]|uniref:Uncharacterized protein n=1 Tax=Nasonia vitripennis TaxID=7425 RepID=A0A7M7PYZ1_NASVI|nr:uncharacterized protein LOC103317814 isoform X2 [Nasonia vitripennis]